jgi:hypothetical protein
MWMPEQIWEYGSGTIDAQTGAKFAALFVQFTFIHHRGVVVSGLLLL